MSWRVVARPEVDADVAEGATWYEDQQPGLGVEFIEEVFRVWDTLAENPLLNSRRTRRRNIRWRYPERFPYRVIYEIDEASRAVIVHAVCTPPGTNGTGSDGYERRAAGHPGIVASR